MITATQGAVSADVQSTAADDSEPSPRGAIDRAFANVDSSSIGSETAVPSKSPDPLPPKIASERPAAEPTPSAEPAPADAKAIPEPPDLSYPPEGWSKDAQDLWAGAPEYIRAEIHRMHGAQIAELAAAKEAAVAFEEYRPFAEALKETGQSFNEVLGFYTGIEALLARDPVGGLEQICSNLGTTLKDVARQVLAQPTDPPDGEKVNGEQFPPTMQPAPQETGDLRETISQLQKTVDGLVERLAPAEPARKGQLSVTGAPGGNATGRKAPETARDAINNAFATMGIG